MVEEDSYHPCTFRGCDAFSNRVAQLAVHNRDKHRVCGTKSGNNVLVCPYEGCPREYVGDRSERNLSYHFATTHNGESFFCLRCGFKMRHRPYLAKHIRASPSCSGATALIEQPVLSGKKKKNSSKKKKRAQSSSGESDHSPLRFRIIASNLSRLKWDSYSHFGIFSIIDGTTNK